MTLPRIPMAAVAAAYAEADGAIENAALYRYVAERAGIPTADLEKRDPVGQSEQKHSLAARAIRWHQQSLRRLGVVERVPGKRGVWGLTNPAKGALTEAPENVALVAFSTELGVAIWSSWEGIFPRLDETLHFAISSPPYPIKKRRLYGGPSVAEYIDFICRAFEPIVKNLVRGGCIALNISADIFEPGSPARSLYRERLILALHDRLGLWKMDELIWHNPTRPPGPMQYASKTRQQLNMTWEPVYVLTNDPKHARTDNRRVLEPHSEKHLRLIAKGGEQRERSSSDGAYTLKIGSYGKPTEGKIPRNVLSIGHRCGDQIAVKAAARAAGLPPHGAPMPLKLADFLVRFLSRPGDLGVDPFGGSCTTAKACEVNGRRWITTDRSLEYLLAGSTRFPGAEVAGVNQ